MLDTRTIALIVFALTYAVLGFGALPPLRIDRTGAALVGATAMVACGALLPAEAVAAVDFQTLALLFGMMIVVAHLKLSGFFGWIGERMILVSRTPTRALGAITVLSALLSALFVNDTACILLTPLAIETAAAVGAPALPFLLAVAMGSNAGSVATLTGNPQNMLIGSLSGISYARFAAALAPVAVLSVVVTIAALRLGFRGALAPARPREPRARAKVLHAPTLRKATAVTVLLLAALIGGVNPGLAAMASASILLVTRRIRPARVWAHVDWSLLAMFAGLFVVVRGIEVTGWTAKGLAVIPPAARDSLPALVGASTALSNVVSNVPAVLVLRAWPGHFPNSEAAWLALSMSSTLAGNLTLVGSVANLIVVEQAKNHERIGFWSYARIGVPVALVTIAIGTVWIAWAIR